MFTKVLEFKIVTALLEKLETINPLKVTAKDIAVDLKSIWDKNLKLPLLIFHCFKDLSLEVEIKLPLFSIFKSKTESLCAVKLYKYAISDFQSLIFS